MWWTEPFPYLGRAVPDVYWAAQALVQQSLKSDGSNGPVLDNSLKGTLKEGVKVTDLVQKLKDERGCFLALTTPPWRGDTFQRCLLAREDACIGLYLNSDELEGRCVTTDRKLFEFFQKLLEDSTTPQSSHGRAFVLTMTARGPQLEVIGVAAEPLERGNYNPDVIEDFDHVVSDIKSSDPSGRLAILDGPPGTGKTYAIRALMHECPDALFVFVPTTLIQDLANPSMIGGLLNIRKGSGETPLVLVVEDADASLRKREGDNDNHVSALLQLGDGVIGSLLNIRVICTSNLRDEAMDEAILRPRRLSRKITIGYLNQPVAEDVYKRLTGQSIRIREDLTLSQVYSMAKDAGWKPPVQPKRKLGFLSSFSPADIATMKDDGVYSNIKEMEVTGQLGTLQPGGSGTVLFEGPAVKKF